MKKTIFFILSVITLGMLQTMHAVPADPGPITIKQPNGKTLTLVQKGDEYFHWAITLDGYTLVRDETQTWVYAMPDANGNLVSSGVIACNVEERSQEDRTFLKTISPGLFFSAEQIKNERQHPASDFMKSDLGNHHKAYPTVGTVKLLVILVEFPDIRFTYPKQNFQNLVSQENYSFNGATGSVKDYYYENSNGRFNMDIDVVGPVCLSHMLSYYGGYSNDRNDGRVGDLVREAIRLVDDSVDFSQYDNDNDGIVDAIHIFFAGTPESSTGRINEIWPHRSNVYQARCNDNVGFRVYSISSERQVGYRMVGIGTICHELGHVLGLPDWYDTDYTGSGGTSVEVGKWSLMSGGPYLNNGNTPPYMSAVEREMVGWHQHTFLDSTSENNILYPIQDSNLSFATALDNDTNELYVMEYRKTRGWDTYLPNSGMYVYYVDRSVNDWYNSWKYSELGDNRVNTDPTDRGYYLVIPDNVTDVDRLRTPFGMYSDFPPQNSHPNFTQYTTPSTKNKAGAFVNIPITNIKEYPQGDSLRFDFKSSCPAVQTGQPDITSSGQVSTKPDINYSIVHEGDSIVSSGILYSRDGISEILLSNAAFVEGSLNGRQGSVKITDMNPGTNYYYRAYAIGLGDTAYGEVKMLTTSTGLGAVSTQPADQITKNSMRLHAKMTDKGEGSFVRMGICLVEGDDPGVDTSHCIYSTTDSTLTDFSYDATGLNEGVLYSYRAFIENSFGVSYGSPLNTNTDYTPIANNNIIGETVRNYCHPATPELITAEEATGGVGEIHYRWVEIPVNRYPVTAPGIADGKDYQSQSTVGSHKYARIAYCNDIITNTSRPVTINIGESIGGTATYTGNDTVKTGDYIFKLIVTDFQGSVVRWERNVNNQGWEELPNSTNKVTTFDEQTSVEGIYRYRCVVRHFECNEVMSDEVSVVVKNDVGLEEISSNTPQFTLYPNPTKGEVTLDMNIPLPCTVSVTTLDGKKVLEKEFGELNGTLLDLSSLKPGSYIVNVKTERHSISQPLMIQ